MVRATIIYSDGDIAVIAKPPRCYVHPSPGHEEGTLCEALVKRFPQMRNVGSDERPGVVHRLDAETSGAMVFALNQKAYLALRRDFERHDRITKTYLAVLHGAPKEKTGTLAVPIGRKKWDPRRMAIDGTDAKPSVTHWTVLAKKAGLALVEFRIETGRTHQIRVVAAHLGHPIVGDSLYGNANLDARIKPPRLLLHAVELAFDHPVTHKRMTFAVPPPPDMMVS